MPEGNQEVLNQSIRYAVFLERYKTGLTNRLQDLLLDLDLDTMDQLLGILERMSDTDLQRFLSNLPAKTRTHQRLNSFIDGVEADADRKFKAALIAEIAPVAALKMNRNRKIAATISLQMDVPSTQRVIRALSSDPFQGRVLKDWSAGWSAGRKDRVLSTLRMGFAQGDSIPDMVKRLRGTKSQGYKDGVLNVSRRSAATIARTATNHMVAQADAAFVDRNKDAVKSVVWTSVLDTRTSDVCRANDGREFTPNEKWQGKLPAHPNCRSVWTFAYEGQGPREDKDYYEWLRDQPRDYVVEALGRKRAALFLDGGLGKRDLIRVATGRPYTLEELRKREAQAFDAVGF